MDTSTPPAVKVRKIKGSLMEKRIIELLKQGLVFIDVAQRLHISAAAVNKVAKNHPELDRNARSANIQRRIERGGWTKGYVESMEGQSDNNRYAFGSFLVWRKARFGRVGELQSFTAEEFDLYVERTLESRSRVVNAVAHLYVVVNAIIRVEPTLNWTWLRIHMRATAARLYEPKSRASDGAPRTPPSASEGEWPASWREIYARAPLQDPVAAFLSDGKATATTDNAPDWRLKSTITVFINTVSHFKQPIEISSVNIKLFVLHYGRSYQAVTTRNHLGNLAFLAASLGLSKSLIQDIRNLRNHFAASAKQQARRKDAIVLPSSLRVIELARQLMAEARLGRTDNPADATVFQTGLMLLVLAFIPLRATNFADLTLTNWRINGCLPRVEIQAASMKNRREFELPVTEILQEGYEEYIESWRPVLLGKAKTDRLWVMRSKATGASGIAERLTAVTLQHLGVRVTLHDFRDIAATTALTLMPEQPGLASAILGQVSPESLEDYVQSSARLASMEAFSKVVTGLAADLKTRKKQGRTATSEHGGSSPPHKLLVPGRARKHRIAS